MATTARRKTQTELGLGWTHRQAAKNLHDNHIEGTLCDWCGRPMWDKDRTKNWDYNPQSTNPNNGKLHADHSQRTRAECIKLGLPIGLPDRLLHGACNIQRGDGGNDHLAATANNNADTHQPCTLYMPWPFTTDAHVKYTAPQQQS